MTDKSSHTDFIFDAAKVLVPVVAKSVTRLLGIRKDNAGDLRRKVRASKLF